MQISGSMVTEEGLFFSHEGRKQKVNIERGDEGRSRPAGDFEK
jgi:hypothetical protein